jgi:hypothetical protein
MSINKIGTRELDLMDYIMSNMTDKELVELIQKASTRLISNIEVVIVVKELSYQQRNDLIKLRDTLHNRYKKEILQFEIGSEQMAEVSYDEIVSIFNRELIDSELKYFNSLSMFKKVVRP